MRQDRWTILLVLAIGLLGLAAFLARGPLMMNDFVEYWAAASLTLDGANPEEWILAPGIEVGDFVEAETLGGNRGGQQRDQELLHDVLLADDPSRDLRLVAIERLRAYNAPAAVLPLLKLRVGEDFDDKAAGSFLDAQTLRNLEDGAILADGAMQLGLDVSRRCME